MSPHAIQAGKALGDNSQLKMRLPCPAAMQVAFIFNQLVTRAIFLVQFMLDRCLNIHTPLFIYPRAVRYKYGQPSAIIRQARMSDNAYMKITWYPGHMHKAGKELRKLTSSTDVVVEVLDARIPAASSNPLLREIFKGKPTLKLLNKCDLAESVATSTWQTYFNASDNTRSLTLSRDKQSISMTILEALAALTDNTRPATAKRRQAVIFGVPNVGKSTILNAIAGRKLAKTGNEPAITKGQQRIKLNETWTLIDTPGMLWPKLENQQAALWLAMTGSIRHTALDVEELGWMAAECLKQVAPALLKARYGLDVLPEQTEQLVAAIAHATGSLTKGGLIDGDKVAQALLNDFRSGKLGALTLESITS